MTDPVSMPFEMNQSQLDAAVLAYLPRQASHLTVDYTNGRAPRGLSAAVNLTEEQIREAVIQHAKSLVNPIFKHFSISFKATRGEDGMTTSIIASTHPIAPETPTDAPASRPAPSPVVHEEAPVEPTPAAESVQKTETVEEAADEADKAPWDGDEAPETTGAEEAPAAAEPAPTETVAEERPAPTPGRSKLFGDLQRPTND